MEQDETAQRASPAKRAAKANDRTGPNLQKVTTEETVTVETCDSCGADLSEVAPSDRERRVLYDIVFQVIEQRVEAEVKQCPDCQARNKGAFPASMPGPVQYGSGLQAFIINLLVAHMLSCGAPSSWSGRSPPCACPRPPASATSAACTRHCKLGKRPPAPACWHLRPCMPTKTGLRVDRKNHWLHVLANGSLTLKFLHPKRGKAAIEAIGLIPRFRGTLVHDCGASYLGYEQCRHQLCGAHLVRELTFIVESSKYRWARLLKALLQEACHKLNRSQSKVLSEAAMQGPAQALPHHPDPGR